MIRVHITPANDELCRDEARWRHAVAVRTKARGVAFRGGQIIESEEANYYGVIGEFAVCRWLEVPMRWRSWAEDGTLTPDRLGLDIVAAPAGPSQVKYNTYAWGDFYLAWKERELRAPFGILVTPAPEMSGSGVDAMIAAWVTADRFLGRMKIKDYGHGPVRAVEQRDMMDVAMFPTGRNWR